MISGKILAGINRASGSKRMAMNTVFIYSQRLVSALIALVSTPIILRTLGVSDYGIYTLTVGFVGVLAFLNWSLSSATQRFIAYAIGEEKPEKLKQIFFSAFSIHLVYGLLVFLILATFGVIFVDRLLTIPSDRIEAARIVLVFVGFISFLNIITVPLTGLFRAHENFIYLAIIGIAESLLKLGIAISLIYIQSDRLIIYSLLLSVVSLFLFLANLFTGRRLYPEINYNKQNYAKGLFKELLSFIGWNLIGSLAIMSRNQAVTVLINIFFGVIKNAAYGIAMQINSAVGILSQGIIAAISPRIVKLAGAGENEKMIYLMRTMSKMALLVVSVVILPFFFEASFILQIWLKEVPEDAVLFSKLILAFGLLMLQSAGITLVFNAIGKVKDYNIWVSLILILNIPISYMLFKIGLPAYTIILTGMVLELIALFVRLVLLRKHLEFSIPAFLGDVFIRISPPMILATGLVFLTHMIDANAWIHLFLTFSIFLTVYPFMIYFLALDKKQQEFFKSIITSGVNLFRKQKS